MTKLQNVLLCAASAFALLSAEPALAADNTATITQNYNNDTATQNQSGSNNTATATQDALGGYTNPGNPNDPDPVLEYSGPDAQGGGFNVSSQTQYGNHGNATVMQSGGGNTATQFQTGGSSYETGTIRQYGGGNGLESAPKGYSLPAGVGNTASQTQSGSHDHAYIMQSGYGQTASQSQSDGKNTATIHQYGVFNTANQSQSGDFAAGQSATINQGTNNDTNGLGKRDPDDSYGRGNYASQTQTGANGPATAVIQQTGAYFGTFGVGYNNKAVQYQQSGRAFIYQNGVNSNKAYQTQLSTEEPSSDYVGAFARITQVSSNNTATQFQTSDWPGDSGAGAGPKAYIVQEGPNNLSSTFNTATQWQFDADGSYASIVQNGYHNTAFQEQNDDNHYGNKALILQTGGNDNASQYQSGAAGTSASPRNYANIKQYGSYGLTNTAIQSQIGYGNTATILQGKSGSPVSGNFAEQIQESVGDIATIHQYGNNNTATQVQH